MTKVCPMAGRVEDIVNVGRGSRHLGIDAGIDAVQAYGPAQTGYSGSRPPCTGCLLRQRNKKGGLFGRPAGVTQKLRFGLHELVTDLFG